MTKGKIYFEGVSRNGDEFRVIGDDSAQIITRNHVIVKIMTNVYRAIELAKYFCER